MTTNMRRVAASAACLAAALLLGCEVQTHKDAHGDGHGNDDVKIATPFGGMTVKTDAAVVEGGTGLAPYPGATLVKKDRENGDRNNGAADINMSFGSFHLGVKAISYRTADPPDKVVAFYRKDMAHFGAVVLCRGNHAVGSPDHTEDGLSCGKTHGSNIHIDEESAQSELKAGSKQHQHIVSIDPEGSGTRFGLVALDLPRETGSGDDKD